MKTAPILVSDPEESLDERFDEFIAWASPSGTAGFNRFHHSTFEADTPWYEYSKNLLPHSHSSARSWFIKQEYLGKPGIVGKTKGLANIDSVKRPTAMIQPGRFLQFAKAYVNYQYSMRSPRSVNKALVMALIFLEKALRDMNNGDNDPTRLTHLTFHRADRAINRTVYGGQKKRDVAMELERIADELQGGTRVRRSASGARARKATQAAKMQGLRLIDIPFSFQSKVKSPPRYGKIRRYQTIKRRTDSKTKTLSAAEVAAAGLAYRQALSKTGASSMPTFVASLLGLALTTASVRASDLQPMRRDALFVDEDVRGRMRLRVPRPKIGVEQIIPIPKAMNEWATEFMTNILQTSQEASEAFADYIAQSPKSQSGIKKLFIPERLRSTFEPDFIPHAKLAEILCKLSAFERRDPGKTLCEKLLTVHSYVQRPGDAVFEGRGVPFGLRVRVRDVVAHAEENGAQINIPAGVAKNAFVCKSLARSWIRNCKKYPRILDKLFESEKALPIRSYISTSELKAVLLADFKAKRFPHWPYVTKERTTRLDEALCVYLEPTANATSTPGTGPARWWRPSIFSMATLQSWISGSVRRSAILFSMFNIKLKSGEFPAIAIHKTRHRYHTAALRAGVSRPLANEIAGRKSDWQGQAYDDSTPEEIISRGMETFDPDARFKVIGPVAENQSMHIPPLVDREEYLRHIASPKHITEPGGCRRDWSIEPCDMHHDCVRCGALVWRKGDTKRLPYYERLREDTIATIRRGKAKLRANPRMQSIKKHLVRCEETLKTCNEVFRIEADPTIEIGTIVTFSTATTAMSTGQFQSHLREIEFERLRGHKRADKD